MVTQTTRIEERKKSGVVDLQQRPCFKVEKSKMPMVSILCQEKCVQYHFSKINHIT